jgi:hypothetical protein
VEHHEEREESQRAQICRANCLGASTLSFVNLNEYVGLVIGVSREDFGFFGRNGGVTLDKGSHDTSGRLDTEGRGGNIEQEKVLSLLSEVGKDCRTATRGPTLTFATKSRVAKVNVEQYGCLDKSLPIYIWPLQ